MNRNRDTFVERVRQDGIEQVRVIFLDYNGIPRARSVAIGSLPAVLQRGVNFSSPTVDFNSRDLFPPRAAFDLASPDVWAVPDATTYRLAPGASNTGEMLADLVDADGQPWAGCPRTALRRLTARAAEMGLVFQVGFEPEGYILRHEDDGPALIAPPQFATLDGLDTEPEFTSELLSYLAAVGIEVTQWSEEYGPGQIEVNLRHGAAPGATDDLVTFRHAFRAIARKHGLLGTFMPKPFGDHAGSGLHVHLSAVSAQDSNTNLFDDPHDAEYGLAQVARHILGGLLRHGAALTALGATTVNSYKRFFPGSWAPTHIVWSYASRAAFIRIPERQTARRLELRIGDPACNPYIYLAGILTAALDGLENEIDPGSPTSGDVGARGGGSGEIPVPHTLERALEALERDHVIRVGIGALILDELIKVKRSEWDTFVAHVGAWDREWYLGRY
ncbi:MAG: glutamine synthetase family protein [Chloroflexota bacterium]